jgi:hypothetical protein
MLKVLDSMLETMSPIQIPHGGDSACDAMGPLMGKDTDRTMSQKQSDIGKVATESDSLLSPIRKGRLRRINQNTSERSVGMFPWLPSC